MEISKEEQQLFDVLIDEYIDKHGIEALKDIYKLHRKLDTQLQMKNFPARHIFRTLFFREMKAGVFNNLSVKEIAAKEGVATYTIYRYQKAYYSKKKKIFKH